jgi:hypothetical protein
VSLFKRKEKPAPTPEAKPKTLFGAMSSRASDAARVSEAVVVDKGKSFALFKKPAKPVNEVPPRSDPVVSADDSAEPVVEDVTYVLREKKDEPPASKGLFGFRKSKDVSVEAATKPTARKGLFSRQKETTAEEGPAVSKQKPQKAEKPRVARRGLAGSKAVQQMYLHTELNEGTKLWWKLTAGSLERIEETEVDTALTFSAQDFRYTANRKLQYAQANNLALSESSEYCSLVNASGGPFGAVHATPRERASAMPWLIQPGMLALDRLLATKLKDRQPSDDIKATDSIVGFSFEDAVSGNSLVVLYKLSGDHQLSNLQVSVNAEDIGFVLNQFAQAARVNSEDAPVILFSAEELLDIGGSLEAFPNEPVWQGYSVRKMLTGALAISAVAAASGAGLAGMEYVKQMSLKSEKARLESSVRQTDEKANLIVSNSARSFAQKASLDHRKIFAGAQSLWMPGAVVVMKADYPAGNSKYELRMMLPQGEPFGNRPSVAFALSPESLSKLVDYQAEEGCIREGTYIAGSLNEVQIIVNCQVPTTPLSRYRLD